MTPKQLIQSSTPDLIERIFPDAMDFFSMLWRQENVVDYELLQFFVYYNIHEKRIPIGKPYPKLSMALDVLSEHTKLHREPGQDFWFEIVMIYDNHPIDKIYFY